MKDEPFAPRHWVRIAPGATCLLRLALAIATACLLLMGSLFSLHLTVARADNDPPLTVEIGAAYNLVVDSNVESPSTYAPSVATVMGRFCNTGTAPLEDVWGYIGNHANGTPGIYPSRDSSGFAGEHPALENTGIYSFTHLGGRVGLKDASRYLGDLGPGECQVQYWHFTYPRCSNSEEPPCSDTPTWGDSVKPEDDLWLEFDIWATAGSLEASQTQTMTMRNEISAMANKIEPNPSGRWFNTDSDTVKPGDVITSNGILYELGNVNKGFDNDGDYVYDCNAWLQPIGDTSYDPSCFRLIRTSGKLTVSRSGGKPDRIIPFEDQLYFMNLPPDNNGVIGEVYYSFLALDGPCSSRMTPYQEVASGADNEKFNADFGAGLPSVGSSEPEVAIDKDGNVTVTSGSPITYGVDLNNTGSTDAGLPLNSAPLVVSDTIPSDTTFTGDMAASVGVEVLYSTDNGETFTTTQPSDLSTVTNLQWWLTDTLAAGASGTVTFSAQVAGSPTNAFIENCTKASFGAGDPFSESCSTTMVEGTNTIGDFVWQDDDGDGVQDEGEVGLNDVTVSLYYDENGDGALGSDDPLVVTTTTATGGTEDGIYRFESLPNGDFVVAVDGNDADLPYGYSLTTAGEYAVTGLGTSIPSPYLLADFGFGPVLALDKERGSGEPIYEENTVSYTIELMNTRPGNGTGQGDSCQYTVWAATEDTAHSGSGPSDSWDNPSNAWGASGPDGRYASSDFANNVDELAGTDFSLGVQAGDIVSVEVLISLYMDGQQSDDQTTGYLWHNDVVSATKNYAPGALSSYGDGQSNQGILAWDVTDAGSWAWSDFNGSIIDVGFYTDKGGGSGDTILYVDSMGLRVTTDQSCGGSQDTIATLPLTDTYDADRLQFVSAEPGESGVTTGGTSPYANTGAIAWDDLGPLYAGQTKLVTVTFEALEPTDNATETITNTAFAENAAYYNGNPVNEVTDKVTNTLAPTGEIGDFVWRDLDNDGVQDGGAEVGISNAVISLTAETTITVGGAVYAPGSVVTTTTDSDGLYLFEGLRYSGNYTVTVDTNTLPIGSGSATNTYDEDDGTANPNGQTVVTLDHNATDGTDRHDTADFGYDLPSIIEGTIWNDWNRSGANAPDAGEEWLTGVVITLTNGTTYTTTTDANGHFSFVGDFTGSYNVTVGTGTGDMSTPNWTQSYDTDGTGSADTVAVTVASGGQGRADFSYHQTGSYALGDTLYVDWDGDGGQDSGEEGISDVTIWLYEDSNGDGEIDPDTDALVMTDTADASGTYGFSSLPAGDYVVVVDQNDADWPAGTYVQTEDYDGTVDGQGAVASGDLTTDAVDFGYQPVGSASIGDLVWEDADGDGIYDTGESGIANISVNLYEDADDNGVIDSGTDALVATTTTDGDGTYVFTDLPAGDYLVDVDTTDPDLPTDEHGNPYVLSTANDPHHAALSAGEAYDEADFGFTTGGQIGDTVWQDNDGDGNQDEGEPGVDSVTIELYTWEDTDGDGLYDHGEEVSFYDSTTTDVSGVYTFTGLLDDDYAVVVVTTTLPTGFTQTADPDWTGVCSGNQCDSATGIDLYAGQVIMSADFGYRPPGVIGDYVWLDFDDDGVQDATEQGIGGVVITLTLESGGVITTVTDSDGYYSFGDVSDGTHTVEVDTSTLPELSDMAATYDADGSADSRTQVTISGGNIDETIDFGYRYDGAYAISGTVFFDSGGTGDGDTDLFGAGDSPYESISVYLWNDSGQLVGVTTTHASGVYTFTNLPNHGTFTVSVDPNAPQLGGLDLTASPTAGQNHQTVTISRSDVTDQDFGFYAEADFGDLPEAYAATLLADEGAYHISGTLKLGNSLSPEGDGTEDGTANGDDYDDGVKRDTSDTWEGSASVSLTVTVTGGTGRVVGWFDWDNDGAFDDNGSFQDFGDLIEGVRQVTVTVPGDYVSGTTVNARFRLFDPSAVPGGSVDSGDYLGSASDGEVEDYQWTFGTTALSLRGFRASSNRLSAAAALVALGILFIGWIRRGGR